MNDFTYDIVQKKRLAGQARHRKCGSKSRKCSLASDRLTQKQWREKCGEMVSYQLGKPMAWDQFKQLPSDIQKIYINSLMEKFCPNATDLAAVFGVTAPTVTKYLGDEFGIRFPPGKKMPQEYLADFKAFLGEQKPDTLTAPAELSAHDMAMGTVKNEEAKLSMTEFSLTFDGKFDPKMIHNSIVSMLQEGTNARIEIRCSIHT